MLIYTELFSNVSGLGLGEIFGPRPWPHAQLASLTSLIPRIFLPQILHMPSWFKLLDIYLVYSVTFQLLPICVLSLYMYLVLPW